MKDIFDFLLAIKWPLFAVIVIWKILNTYLNIVKIRWEDAERQRLSRLNEHPKQLPPFLRNSIENKMSQAPKRESLSVREGEE